MRTGKKKQSPSKSTKSSQAPSPKQTPYNRKTKRILNMQRTLGNQVVRRMLEAESDAFASAPITPLTGAVQTSAIQKREEPKYDPAENLKSGRFAGIPELEQAYDNQTLIFNGRAGSYVEAIQQALEDFGFPLKEYGVDGIYGSETETAVIAFQRAAGAEMVDGIIGPETMRLLDAWAGRGEEDEKEKRREETLEDTREQLLEKARKAIEEGGEDQRPEYALCLLDMYKSYLAGAPISSDMFMRDLHVHYYIENNLGVEGTPHFEHPDDRSYPHAFKLLDRYLDKSPRLFSSEVFELVKDVLAGTSRLYWLSKNPYFAMPHRYTIEFLEKYFAQRTADPNDIYHCFQ